MSLPLTTANVRFEFSRTMEHPTAGDPVGAEVWESADGFFEGKLHWVLGHDPSWVECWFHAGTARVFPWTRVKASDEAGVIGIYRFDQVTEEFSDKGRVWKAFGRCSIYGATDNYLRSPRIYTQTGAVDPDSGGYQEWPVLGPDRLKSCEEVLRVANNDSHNGLYVNCLAAPEYPTEGYTFKTDAARDDFLSTQMAESAYATTPEKVGPNYVSKGVRRGWVFKDIFRHTAGAHDSPSRPVLGVYNRTQTRVGGENEGDVVNSNFQQAQAGGAGANALAHDVAISFPWLSPAAASSETQDTLSALTGDTPAEPSDLGYDYRTVWPGKTDPYAESGQAVEIFQRGGMEWDDSVCVGCGEPSHEPTEEPCPVLVFLTYFQADAVLGHERLRYFPNRGVICSMRSAANINICGLGVLVTIVDTTLADYDLTTPESVTEWRDRLQLRGIPVFVNGGSGEYTRSTMSTAGRLCWGFSGRCLQQTTPSGERVGCCWKAGECLSHSKTVTVPSTGASITSCSYVKALYATPSDGIPQGGVCQGTEDNIAVYVDMLNPSNDFYCYQRPGPDSPCPPGGVPEGADPVAILGGRLTAVGRKASAATAVAGDARLDKLKSSATWQEFSAGTRKTFWKFKDFVHPDGTVLNFVIDANDGSFRFRGLLLASVDEDTEAWTQVTTLPDLCMGITMSADGVLWAIVDERESPISFPGTPDPQTSRIYKSTDKGATWTLSKTLTEGGAFGRHSQAYNVAAHPTNANIIVVQGTETVSNQARFWRTTNGGTSWTYIVPAVTNGTMPISLGRNLLFGYNSAGRLAYAGVTSPSTGKLMDSVDNGTTWTIQHTFSSSSPDIAQQYIEKCGYVWWVQEKHVWRSPLDHSSFEEIATQGANGLFNASITCLDCTADMIILGADCVSCAGALGTASVYVRPNDLSTDWAALAPTMPADLGYTLRVNTQGMRGITLVSDLHPQGPGNDLGSPSQTCLGMLSWEVLVDSRGGYYSRARAFGMGMNNAGGDQAATIPDAETTWNPGNITGCFGGENGPFKVRRDIIINDYGINEGPELHRLANSYLPSEDKSLGGFTTVKFQAGGILRATENGPFPDKPLQAGDRLQLSATCEGPCKIAGGAWVVDEVEYAFPEGISTITISKRPAAQVGSYPQSNIRTIGESAAGQGQVFESAWFHVLDPLFKAGTVDQNEPGLYDLFTFDHYLGIIPQNIVVIAAKTKIFNWFDDVAVAAAYPLYVPEAYMFDQTQVQGVGYEVVHVDEQSIRIQFRRFLFYDDREGRWIFPPERVLKVWMMP